MISVYVCVGYISFLLKAELSADTDSGGWRVRKEKSRRRERGDREKRKRGE